MVLCERLVSWFTPLREQAGAQKNRGCLEHIVTLRILTDAARRKKMKLFVTFIDFSKAYDMVPRQKLFSVLKRLGCGMVMLAALVSMYRVTESIVGSAVMAATLGVRQGTSTSCFLFVIFMNELVKVMKEKCEPERFLDWLHILVLMDDTVLLSTSRQNMMKKVEILNSFCHDYGMVVNNSKTKFFVINGDDGDTEPMVVGELMIEHCSSYVYLGSPFTSDGSVSSAVRVHGKNKLCHVLKYVSFVTKNNDVPFIVKRRVLEAALMSSLMYGCESWLCADIKPVMKLYNWSIKQLLGVRKTTSNLVCYAEVGYPALPDYIRVRQHTFFYKMWQERCGMQDDPLVFAIKVASESNTPTGKLINEIIRGERQSMATMMEKVYSAISNSNSSRCVIYKELNPDFRVHDIYRTKHNINELHRTSFTRLRVSGHSLAVETGRWNRRGRGRLPVEERLCVCGAVQTEKHVVEECPLSQNIRNRFNITSVQDLFRTDANYRVTCQMSHDILELYK